MNNSLFLGQVFFFLAVCIISTSAPAIVGNQLSFSRLAQDIKNNKIELKFSINSNMDFGNREWVYIENGEVKDNIDEETEARRGDYCKLFLEKEAYKRYSNLITTGDIPSLSVKKIKIGKNRVGFSTPKYTFSFNKNSFFKKLVCYQYPYKKINADSRWVRVNTRRVTLDYLTKVITNRETSVSIFNIQILLHKQVSEILPINNDKTPSIPSTTYPDLAKIIPPFAP